MIPNVAIRLLHSFDILTAVDLLRVVQLHSDTPSAGQTSPSRRVRCVARLLLHTRCCCSVIIVNKCPFRRQNGTARGI